MTQVYGHGKVSRNVTISHCNGQCINPTSKDPPEFVDFCIDLYGTYTEQRATRQARRITGDNTIIINNVEYETHFYTMSIDDFVKQAERTN